MTSLTPDRSTRPDRIAVLQAFGLDAAQIDRLLAYGVTVDQLRGMLKLQQYAAASADTLARIAAQIDRIAELEKLGLDSHTA